MHLWRSNGRFLKVFYVLKESFKYFLQLRYAISSIPIVNIKENTVVQQVRMPFIK